MKDYYCLDCERYLNDDEVLKDRFQDHWDHLIRVKYQ